MNWQVGDRVRVIDSISINYGVECTVISPPIFTKRRDIATSENWPSNWVYMVDIECARGELPYAYAANELEPIYDGNEKVSWESMKDIWEPLEVTV